MREDLTSTFDLIGPADYYDQRHQIKKNTLYLIILIYFIMLNIHV